MITKIITDNNIDNWVLIEPSKNLFGELPKEESQMFFGKEYSFNPLNNFKYERGIDNTTLAKQYGDNGEKIIVDSPITATNYAGIINKKIITKIREEFCSIKFYKEGDWNINEVFTDSFITKFKIIGENQFLKIPQGIFKKNASSSNTDTDNYINDYGTFYIHIEPSYVETKIIYINPKEHYTYDNTLAQLNSTEGNRRTVYELDINNFKNTNFNFDRSYSSGQAIYSNRLLGSLVINKNWDGTHNNEKIITNDYFNFSSNNVYICLSPDYMGVDTPINKFNIGDVIRIYPSECYFEPITIKVDFSREINEYAEMRKFLLNDAVRDLNNNIIEVYDDNGLTIEDNGQVSGGVYLSFQVIEKQGKEIRKKLN